MMKLDPWQQQVLDTKGNICLRSGRQVGKSTVISIKAGEFAVNNPKKVILIIAFVERQSFLMLEKTLDYLLLHHKGSIKKGKDRPTKSKIMLKNGSVIYSLPAGVTGAGIRGYTVDMLIADEAAFIPEDVWTAVTPMLATTKGTQILLSTPHGKAGYYYDCFSDPNFTSFHVSSEDCERIPKAYLDQEKKRHSTIFYAQEYLGEFIDDLRQVFPDHLIRQAMVLKRRKGIDKNRKYYLGVDIARMGDDESTFQIIDRTNRNLLQQVESLVTTKTLTTASTRLIISLDNKYHFSQIFIDDGGMGVGVFDQLLDTDQTKRKTIAINNTARPLQHHGSKENKAKRILKEDIFNNMLMLMEQKKIQLLDDPEIFLSLKSVQFEIKDSGRTTYFGNYMHIADGLVRAAWCARDKKLNLFCA